MRMLALLLFISFFYGATAQHSSQQYILELENEINPELKKSLASLGLEVDRKIFSRPILYRLKTTNISLAASQVDKILEFKNVLSIKIDQEAELRTTLPNDPLFGSMWHHDVVGSTLAWDFATSGLTPNNDQVVLAILDSGYELDHPDLQDNLWTNDGEIPDDGIDNDNNGYIDDYIGVNFFTGKDDHARRSHGTEVIGAMGASGDNDEGITGMTWQAKLLPMSKSVGGIFESDFIESYEYAIEQRRRYNESDGAEGAFVVAMNLSLGISEARAEDFPQWCAVYEEMGRQGILGVSATANDDVDVDIVGDMPPTCPSIYQIAVTGTDRDDRLMNNVAYGVTHIDMAAPGDEILCTSLDRDYSFRSGTSLAAPLVTGAIGLMYMAASDDLLEIIESNPQTGARIMRELLLGNVEVLPELADRVATSGRLNVGAAVRAASFYSAEPLPESMALFQPTPNPVTENLNIALNLPRDGRVDFSIFDLHMGREVHAFSESVLLFSGTNEFTLPVSHLASGMYLFVAEQEGERVMKKFIKIEN